MDSNDNILDCSKCMLKDDTFSDLRNEEFEMINKNRLEVRFSKDEVICKQGSFASHIIYLKKGLIKLYLEGRDKNLILRIETAGCFLCLPSLFQDNVFHYSAAAYEDSEVCMIDRNVFQRIVENNAAFASKIIKIINHDTLLSYDRIFCLTQKQLPGRFADILLCLSNRIYKSDSFELTLSRKDIAESPGMSVESLSRLIKDFNQHGIIHISGRKLQILNMEILHRISDKG